MGQIPILWRRIAVALWDVVSWAFAFVMFVTLRYDLRLSHRQWVASLSYAGAACLATVIAGFGFHLYLGRSRVGSFEEATSLGLWTLVQSVFLGLIFLSVPHFPRGVALVLPALALMLMGSGRWLYRSMARESRRTGKSFNHYFFPARLFCGFSVLGKTNRSD